MLLYRNILSQASRVTWRHKYLWFFGLFAALLGNGGEYEILIRSLSGDIGQGFFPSFRNIASTGIFSRNILTNIGQIIKNDPFSLVMLLIVGLIILFLVGFLVWMMIISQAALVNNSAAIITGKKSPVPRIKEGVLAGIKNFWPVFGLNIIIKIIIYLAFILVGLPIIFSMVQTGRPIASFLYLILFLIFIPLAIALSFMIKYSIAYVVIKGSNFFQAISQGWSLFKRNWLVSIEMAFILFFINFLVGLGIILAVLILTIPFLFLALLFYNLFSLAGFWLIAFISLIILLFIIIVSGAALATFQISAWTGLFIELVSQGGISKIMRVINSLRK